MSRGGEEHTNKSRRVVGIKEQEGNMRRTTTAHVGALLTRHVTCPIGIF